MIVFGHNSFLLHKCKPSQLGMSADLDTLYTIERRQRYAHLFWIPVFGIGKIWVLRKHADDNLYEPNAELARALNSLPFVDKTPWYTFAFFFLALAGGIIFVISSTISAYQQKRDHEQYMKERNEEYTKAIQQPKPDQYFDMNNADGHVYLKVLGSDPQSITCLVSNKKDVGYSDYRMLEAFQTDADYQSFDTVKIQKAKFLKTINTTGDYSYKGEEVIPAAGKWVLDEYKVFPFPIFKSIQSAYEEGEFLAILQNIGSTAQVLDIKADQSNMTFDGEIIPSKIKAGDMLTVRGKYSEAEPRFDGKVTFLNQANDSAQYKLSIYSSYLTIKPSDR